MVVIDDEWLARSEQQKTEAAPESVGHLIGVALGWLVAAFAVAGVFGGIVGVYYALIHVKTTPDMGRFYGAIGILFFGVTLLIASLLRARVVGHGSIRAGLGNVPVSRLPAIAAMLLAAVAYAVLMNLTVAGVRPEFIAKLNTHSLGVVALALLVATFIIGVFAPLSEELFFRGWLWTGLRRHWGVLPTALLTSAPWLALHLERGILRPVLLVPIAVLLATSRHVGGSVRAPLALHVIYNFATIAPLYWKEIAARFM